MKTSQFASIAIGFTFAIQPVMALPFKNTNTDFAAFMTLVGNHGTVGGVTFNRDGRVNPNDRVKYFGFYDCKWNDRASSGGNYGPEEPIIEDFECSGYADYYTPLGGSRCQIRAVYYYTAKKKWVESRIIGQRWQMCRSIN